MLLNGIQILSHMCSLSAVSNISNSRLTLPDTDDHSAPYTAPHREYYSTEDLVKGQLPQFAYQLHLASGDVEKSVNDEQSIRQFLKGLYGARGPNGELGFDPEKGVLAENLPLIGESRILNGRVSKRVRCFLYVEKWIGPVRHNGCPTLESLYACR